MALNKWHRCRRQRQHPPVVAPVQLLVGHPPRRALDHPPVLPRYCRLLGVAHENHRRRCLRFEEPGKTDRDRRINDDCLNSSLAAPLAALYVFVPVSHEARAYGFLADLTTL